MCELNECMIREDLHWRQKSRIQWYPSSNLNTRFFHLSTIIRRRKNAIDLIKDDFGSWLSGHQQVSDCFVNFYKNHFTSQHPHPCHHIDLSGLIPHSISPDETESLCAIPSDDEIKSIAFSFASSKSPGPDGMLAIFYKSYWVTVGKEVIAMVQSFFASGLILKEMNHTFITLIPKTPNPSSVHQFRPISLCNLSYKIISKTLANRLKILLPKLITPWQAASIHGRNIQDNSIIAHEIFHTLHQKCTGSSGLAALNIDLEKAFDKVEWSFLLFIFKQFGFSEKWIQMIYQCISTPYSILINGSPEGFFTSSQGIHQGDLISPVLFILVTDVLSRLFLQKEIDGSLQGIKIARNCPLILHLMFVDDLVVFSRANQEDLQAIQYAYLNFRPDLGYLSI